ncbi:MAG: NADH-quinone oxidoreductase subunit NuoG, partial [Actinomycetota bacterium]
MTGPAPDPVTLTVDGKEITVPKGTLIIRAAEQLGIEIPRFCDHPFLEPVGACRQCYVEIEGQRKLFTSCTTTVAPDMVVSTQNTSDVVRDAQVANLEFLLLNHPLDCPICDRGGECPLQDQALAFGPGESRYTEPKRVYAKPIALSPLVNLDRERCVLCARCTRFCDEISGDRFIELFARSAGERVSISAGEDFRSPFSGNTVQICPVGALTSEPYRFVARPFDLSSADSVCGHCSAGCNVKVDVRRGELVRVLARDNLEVNDAWICDKGRYAFRHPDLETRVTTPLIRDRGLEPASFGEVLGQIASWTKGARVAFVTGGRLGDEDAYALSKLARTVFGTNDLDHRRAFHGGNAEALAASDPLATTYRDVERARVILVAGLDAEQEVPILHLRIRKAARLGAKVFVVHPRATRLRDVAEHLLCRPEHQTYALERIHESEGAGDAFEDRVAAALLEAGPDAVVLAGERLAEHPLAADVALKVAQRFGAGFAYVTRRANDRGALRAGVHPRLLPGGRRVSHADERAEVEAAWGPLAATEPGRSTHEILEACVRGDVDVLFLIGVDPLRDVLDGDLARRALRNARYKVVQGLELGDLAPYADAFLPAAAWAERAGSVT